MKLGDILEAEEIDVKKSLGDLNAKVIQPHYISESGEKGFGIRIENGDQLIRDAKRSDQQSDTYVDYIDTESLLFQLRCRYLALDIGIQSDQCLPKMNVIKRGKLAWHRDGYTGTFDKTVFLTAAGPYEVVLDCSTRKPCYAPTVKGRTLLAPLYDFLEITKQFHGSKNVLGREPFRILQEKIPVGKALREAQEYSEPSIEHVVTKRIGKVLTQNTGLDKEFNNALSQRHALIKVLMSPKRVFAFANESTVHTNENNPQGYLKRFNLD